MEENEELKTAKQMYEYCRKNGYGRGANRKWSEKHFSLIENRLMKDEYIILPFIGLHNYISASKHDRNYAYAVTNKRIIMAQKGFIGAKVQTIYLNNINDITYKAEVTLGNIIIDTIKETFSVCLNKNAAFKVSERLHEVLDSLKNSEANQIENLSINKLSEADEIMKFKNY